MLINEVKLCQTLASIDTYANNLGSASCCCRPNWAHHYGVNIVRDGARIFPDGTIEAIFLRHTGSPRPNQVGSSGTALVQHSNKVLIALLDARAVTFRSVSDIRRDCCSDGMVAHCRLISHGA